MNVEGNKTLRTRKVCKNCTCVHMKLFIRKRKRHSPDCFSWDLDCFSLFFACRVLITMALGSKARLGGLIRCFVYWFFSSNHGLLLLILSHLFHPIFSRRTSIVVRPFLCRVLSELRKSNALVRSGPVGVLVRECQKT